MVKLILPGLVPIAVLGIAALFIFILFFYLKLQMSSFFRKSFKRQDEKIASFRVRPSLLDGNEQELYRRLIKALPDHIVLAQVAFSQILYTSGEDGKEKFRMMATMKQKVADFVICERHFNMVAAIELDGSSHDPKKDADAKRDEILKQAGLKPIRWQVSRMPDVAQIRWEVLGLKNEPPGEQISRWAPRPTDMPRN